jgi:hypothetical protein
LIQAGFLFQLPHSSAVERLEKSTEAHPAAVGFAECLGWGTWHVSQAGLVNNPFGCVS